MNKTFCNDEFWNLNKTWYTEVPDFTQCFQDTILTLVPCVLFCIIGCLRLLCLSRRLAITSLPWTWLNISKLTFCISLFIVSVSWCGICIYKYSYDGSVPMSTVVTSCARSVTFIVITAMMLKHRAYGVTTSTVLSLFWICFAFCGIIMHRSHIVHYRSQDTFAPPTTIFVLSTLYYSMIYIELILSVFADSRDFNSLESGGPFKEESFLSHVTFSWFNKTVLNSRKRHLTVSDFFPLDVRLTARYLYNRFAAYWKFQGSESELQTQSIAWSLFKSVWPWFISAFILDVLYTIFIFAPPLLLDRIINFVETDQYNWRGYLYCTLILISSFVCATYNNNSIFRLLCVGAQVKSALIGAVFRKGLWMSSSVRKDYPSGNLMNLLSVDVERIAEFALYSPALISAPIRITLIIFMMWQYLGPSCLAGLAVIIILLPITYVFARKSETFTDRQMIVKDLRLKYMNEILNGIKILKFYAWEVPFANKVTEARKEEIKLIRYSQLCFVGTSFVFFGAPFLVSFASFATFLYVDSSNILTPTRAFVSLSLMEQLKFSLFEIPDSISLLVQVVTSIRRIRNFLIVEESDRNAVGNNPDPGHIVTIKNATFTWSKDSEFSLDDIDLNVRRRQLIAVIGSVGAGKTSLLSAILGEMCKTSGSVDVKGSIAYVPQQAWILNRTLKDNVLLVKPMKEEIYEKVLDRCCLKPDLEILPGGDETEIGEKGINLSGGQKQRVNLARAVFQDRDLYLMDDPLSAVDVHVRKSLFDDVIGNEGLLQKKTRILVTHDISVLPHVDLIVSMNNGKIDGIGTYHELLERSTSFANFIREHATLNMAEEISTENNRHVSRLISTDSVASKVSLERSISCERPVGPYGELAFDNKPGASKLIEDERMEIGGVKRGIYLNYARHIGFLLLIPAVFGYTGFVVFEAFSNIWVSKWSADKVINGTHDTSLTTWRLSVFAGYGFAQVFCNVFGTTFFIFGATKASALYHKQMMESIMKSPMSFFDSTPLGRIMNRFSTDLDVVDIQIMYDVDGWLCCALYTIATFVVIGINTPIFLSFLLPIAIFYYIFQQLHLNASRQIKRLEATTRSPIYSHFMESVQGVSSIRAYKIEREFTERLEENLNKHISCFFSTAACNRWLRFWLDMAASLIVFVATLIAIENRNVLQASVVGLVITYALSVTDALMWLVRTNTELENKSVSIERMDEYCHLKSEAPWSTPDDDGIGDNWPQNGEILFDNYSTRYREDLEMVLKEINMSINSNEKVGIVGRTGAGKSSITLALFRIIEPADGTILIDDVDVSKIGLHTLRSKLTIIPQDPVLFTGTLRFNLDPNNEYKEADLWESLENSHLKDYVSTLQEQLEYNVEEGGANLSAGQRQLLCLSRALLKKTKILVLDEATAAVDMDTDRLIQNTIRTAFANHTVITIAHRLNTVIDYDKIIVMDSGQVVEVGNPANLLQDKESIFFKMSEDAGLI